MEGNTIVSSEFTKVWIKFSKQWKHHLEEQLAPTLTEGQLMVLEVLLELQPMKPSQLQSFLDTTPAAITTLLDRMEKSELIRRERNDEDKRYVWISVTDFGEEEARRGLALRNAFVTEALGRLSLHNQQLLLFLFRKVAK